MNPKKAVYLRAQAAILRSSGVSVRETAKILQKSKSWVAKWSSSQEFYDKPRSGRPTVLDRTAKKIIEKAKYKRGNSTRKISKQLKNKGQPGSAATVWRYMSRKGWKPLRRKKLPLLSKNQRKARLVFARKYRKFRADEWENFLFSNECPKYLFHLPNPKIDIVWGSQESQVPPSYQVKGSAKWMVWGGMTGHGLTSLHFIPQGQTVTAECYITKILEKEVKPLFSRRSTTEEPVKRKLFTNKSSATFIQDGAPAHTAKATQQWCKKNLPNFMKKDEWPANSPDLNPIENLWSIIDEAAYRDPIPKTMGGLKSRLRQAWRNIPLASLRELARSMPQRLKNVIQNNGGHSGY